MTYPHNNVDESEKHKFDGLAHDWWSPDGQLRTLHDINSLRLAWITSKVDLSGKNVADIGCGGGLLAEAMARKKAVVAGIDISSTAINAARQHAGQQNLEIDYHLSSPEKFAAGHDHHFDVVTCMEMLEHVPDPVSVVSACARLVKPGGHVFFSTINRTTKAYLFAVLGAEHILKILPAGTHNYAKFIRPSELASWCREYGLAVQNISGMAYSPFQHKAALSKDTAVNYLLHAIYL